MKSWAMVATNTVVYVGLEDRAEFNKLDLPVMEHPRRENGSRCLSKTIDDSGTGVMVIFQHWIEVPA